jgi:plastocyanin
MGSEEYCVGHGTVLSETAIVGADGGLANVFVQVKKGLRGWKFDKGTGTVSLDQKGCMYVPHLLGMQLGQALNIRNSDPIMHNIHAFDFRTGRDVFNFAQTQQGAEQKKTISRAGILQVKCDVHGWMGSYVHVVKHPFFAVTGEDGAFTLAKLPPGEYTIEAWHEKYKTRSQEVSVADGETKEIAFSFSK